jgi:DNA-binding MarR family transcriptional regulator
MEPHELDVPSLVGLAGDGTIRLLLRRIAEAGFPGVRASHGYLVQRLLDEEPTISALAASLGITQQGASKQVRELEALGLVERRPVAGDARARGVRLTVRGRDLVEAGRRARADLERELVERAGAAEVESARRVLATLLELAGLGDDVRRRSVPMPGASD